MSKRQIAKNNGETVVIPPSNQPVGPHTILAAVASVDEERVKPGEDPVADEIAALEDAAEHDPQMAAAEAVGNYQLTPGAQSLIDRAIDSLAKSDGANIPDPEFKLAVKNRAALLSATGGDLELAIHCIVETMGEDPKSIAGAVYNLCYSTMKQALFFANMDYRRYLDPKADFDLTVYRHADVDESYDPESVKAALGHDFYADRREEDREAPAGGDSVLDREWRYFADVYGAGVESTDDIFVAAISDVRTWLQLLTEAFGWNPESPMPFANVSNPDGSFDAITDPMVALDYTEVQSKERRKKRQIATANAMGAAAKLAAEKILAARARK